MMASWIKRLSNDCDNDGLLKVESLRQKRLYCSLRLSVVVEITHGQFHRAGRGRKPRICRWNCHPICHSPEI